VIANLVFAGEAFVQDLKSNDRGLGVGTHRGKEDFNKAGAGGL